MGLELGPCDAPCVRAPHRDRGRWDSCLIDGHQPGEAAGSTERRPPLVNREKEVLNRTEAMFKKKDDRRVKVATEHEAEGNAVREKTARLKSLRLAKEAAEKADADKQPADKTIPVDKPNASNDE
jgi:hypothetical protein